MDLQIHPAKSINGTIEVPGDKSISHRALIFGSLCEGQVEITNFLPAGDTLSTLRCLRDLGVKIEQKDSDVTVYGKGKYGFKTPQKQLSAGNSATTLRILPGLLVAQSFKSTLIGDTSLSNRPVRRIIEPLSQMGAQIQDFHGHAPITIVGGKKLKAIKYKTKVPSAQVKSAILLAGLFAEGTTEVTEQYQSRDHTERMLSYLGAGIEVSKFSHCEEPSRFAQDKLRDVVISGPINLTAKPIEVPGDISSAAFFIAAALLLPSSKLVIKNVGLNPTRAGMINILTKSGARISRQNERTANNEPIADLVVESSRLNPFAIDGAQIPLLIDEIPVLAVLSTQIEGTSVISGAKELRVKETDRLKAIRTQLSLMGANIDEKEDGLIIKGSTKLKGTIVDPGGDHRMAMSLAIASLLAKGQTIIKAAESINISFPGFKELLDKII